MSREQTDLITALHRAETWAIEEAATRLATVSGGEGWGELEDLISFYADELAYAVTQWSEPRSAVHGDKGKRAKKALALIAVARGGFSALQASPFVPTEGHGAAVVALRRVEEWLRYEVPIGTPAATTMLGVVQAAIRDAEQVGTSGASEPKTLPTVQAETAVVGPGEIIHDDGMSPEELAHCCEANASAMGEFSNLGDLLRHAASTIRQQAAVSTGEQLGMSEGLLQDAQTAMVTLCARYGYEKDGLTPKDWSEWVEARRVYEAIGSLLENQNCKRGGDEPQANEPNLAAKQGGKS